MTQIIPSVIAESEEAFEERLKHVAEVADRLHFDVMDGTFVNAESLTFRPAIPEKPTEIHLMVEEPREWKQWIDGATTAIVHAETGAVDLSLLEELGEVVEEVGIALNPGTTIEDAKQCIEEADFVQVMTVEPGSYGGMFREDQVSLIRELQLRYPDKPVSVDGHVTPETIGQLSGAGASRFVSGSFIQEAENASDAIRQLKDAVEG